MHQKSHYRDSSVLDLVSCLDMSCLDWIGWLARAGLPWLDCLGWLALACLGLPWLALACLGLPWLALACLGLPWLALAWCLVLISCMGLSWLLALAAYLGNLSSLLSSLGIPGVSWPSLPLPHRVGSICFTLNEEAKSSEDTATVQGISARSFCNCKWPFLHRFLKVHSHQLLKGNQRTQNGIKKSLKSVILHLTWQSDSQESRARVEDGITSITSFFATISVEQYIDFKLTWLIVD